MKGPLLGVVLMLAFVLLEAVQYVFFGAVFQRLSSFLLGFLIFSATTIGLVGWAAVTRRGELRTAFASPSLLVAVNLTAMFAWAAYLMSVQLIEPAIAYTIGVGIMPITAYVAYRFGVREGDPMRNRSEALGNTLIFFAIIYLSAITIYGQSGFVRGGPLIAAAGIALALTDGILFTWMLIFSSRLNRAGVGPAALLGLRQMLYIAAAGSLAALGVDSKIALPWSEVALYAGIGLILTVPPLYALQKAISLISTLTISAITALGPFIIFGLQVIEGRVTYSDATLLGLAVYFTGALLSFSGALRASSQPASA